MLIYCDEGKIFSDLFSEFWESSIDSIISNISYISYMIPSPGVGDEFFSTYYLSLLSHKKLE